LCFHFSLFSRIGPTLIDSGKKFIKEIELLAMTMGYKIEGENQKEVIPKRIGLVMLNISTVLAGRFS
jgi:hypothetical protein